MTMKIEGKIIKELADFLCVSRPSIYRYIKNGTLKSRIEQKIKEPEKDIKDRPGPKIRYFLNGMSIEELSIFLECHYRTIVKWINNNTIESKVNDKLKGYSIKSEPIEIYGKKVKEWAKLLNLSKQRIHYLIKHNKLEGRLKREKLIT